MFSAADAAMIEGMSPRVRVELLEFPGYTSAAVPERLRQELAGYLSDPHAATDVEWDFDAIR